MKVSKQVIRTLGQAHKHIVNKDFSCVDLIQATIANVEDNKHLNAFVALTDQAQLLDQAEQADARYRNGEQRSVLDGMPIAIKDNLFVKGLQCSAAS
jgi:Asp-tRNA(Asn)/Glu-tRNA(Gln) amidotransferase A subunit family amidase